MNPAISHICGTIHIHARGAFLNGAGSVTEGKSEVATPKSFLLGNLEVPYISAQCWRRWWKQQFFFEHIDIEQTDAIEKKYAGVSFLNAADDLFGYFKGLDEKLSPGENSQRNISQIRSSPIQNSPFHAIDPWDAPRFLTKDEAFVHMKEGTPLPYSSKFYNAYLESIFAIDLSRIGRYRNFNDRQELSQKTVERYLKMNKISPVDKNYWEISDRIAILPKRLQSLWRSLLAISGGAKSPQYGSDITPKLIMLAGQRAANPILSRIFERGESKVKINVHKLMDLTKKFKDLFVTPIFLGVRNGYLENLEEVQEQQQSLQQNVGVPFVITSPGGALSKLTGEGDN